MIMSNCVLRFSSVKLEHLWLWTKHTRLHPCSPLLYLDSLHLNTKVSSTALLLDGEVVCWSQALAASPAALPHSLLVPASGRQVVAPMGSSCLGAGQPALLILPCSLSALQYCTSVWTCGVGHPQLSCLQWHSNGQKCLPVLHSEVNLARQVVIM